jgi:uncharacterized protein (DUF736 family)
MATIGTFTASNNGFTGSVKTLTLNVKATFVATENENDKSPDYRILAGATEFGAAWKKTAPETDREYLSVKLDDPSFPAPIYASLVKRGRRCLHADLVPPQRRLTQPDRTALSAEGHYAASDNGTIVRAAALLDALPGDPTRREEVGTWTRPTPVTPGFVVDLLTATSRIDAGLAARGIEHLLAWPKTYEPDDVLIPAARAFAKQVESTAWPAAGRLREASLDHLRERIALPLEAPRDWARVNPLKCTCGDCRGLGAFLVAPGEQQWRLKAVQDRRTHVEQSVRSAVCDLDLTTERRGSPHTLVATKNQASYERRAKQRRQDLEHVSALGG